MPGLLAGGVAAVGIAYAPPGRRVVVQVAVTVALAVLLIGLVILKSLDLTASL